MCQDIYNKRSFVPASAFFFPFEKCSFGPAQFIIPSDAKRVRNENILQPITLDIHLLTYSLKMDFRCAHVVVAPNLSSFAVSAQTPSNISARPEFRTTMKTYKIVTYQDYFYHPVTWLTEFKYFLFQRKMKNYDPSESEEALRQPFVSFLSWKSR